VCYKVTTRVTGAAIQRWCICTADFVQAVP